MSVRMQKNSLYFKDKTTGQLEPMAVFTSGMDKALEDIKNLNESVEKKYTKPETGIPESDLSEEVRTKLNEETVQTDTTLSLEGYAADAKATGEAIKDLEDKVVEKEDGKGLSSNDFTDELKEKLEDTLEVDFSQNEDGDIEIVGHVINDISPKKEEWTLKGIMTTDNKNTGVNVELSDCTELIIIGSAECTDTVKVVTNLGNQFLTNFFQKIRKKAMAHFKDAFFGFECISTSYSSNAESKCLIQTTDVGYSSVTNNYISDITNIRFSDSSLVESCNIEIWAR